jgi:hypothetical protein
LGFERIRCHERKPGLTEAYAVTNKAYKAYSISLEDEEKD